MMQTATTYAVALGLFLAADALWLGLIARKMYADGLKHLMAPRIRWGIAFAFYALFIAALMLFVIMPHLAGRDIAGAAMMGALFGLACYMTYDLTNLATLRDFPVRIAVIDMLWGGVVGAGVAAGTVALRGGAVVAVG